MSAVKCAAFHSAPLPTPTLFTGPCILFSMVIEIKKKCFINNGSLSIDIKCIEHGFSIILASMVPIHNCIVTRKWAIRVFCIGDHHHQQRHHCHFDTFHCTHKHTSQFTYTNIAFNVYSPLFTHISICCIYQWLINFRQPSIDLSSYYFIHPSNKSA